MIALTVNGQPPPAAFLTSVAYTLDISVNGTAPLESHWTLATISRTIATGDGNVSFQPQFPETHFLHVSTLSAGGVYEQQIFNLSVSLLRPTVPSVAINWAKLNFKPNEILEATVEVHDPQGAKADSLIWTLFRNGVTIQTGSAPDVVYPAAGYGLYRLRAVILDAQGNTIVGESSVAITGDFEVQAAILPSPPTGTMQYLGALYSHALRGPGAQCTSLPFPLSSFTQHFHLIPGTTHFSFELDGDVDDEVLVRSTLGNWTLVGPPSGLTSEDYSYDYKHGQPFLPAPLDLKVLATIEALNTQGATANPFNFKVKVNCYREGPALYQYTRCAYGAFPGGVGARQRRMLALFSNLDIQLDADTDLARGGSSGVERFSIPDHQRILCRLTTSGIPDTTVRETGAFFTESNLSAVYEAERDELGELDIQGVYGIPNYRPCSLTFMQYGQPRIMEKVKHLYGKLSVFVAGGAFNPGTVIRARLETGRAPGYVDFEIPVTQAVYSDDTGTFLKVADLAVDLADFELSRTGMVLHFSIDESVAATGTISTYPLQGVPGDTIYAQVSYPAISVDGACFSNPQFQEIFFDGDVYEVTTPLQSCADPSCGPVGVYCYTGVNAVGSIQVVQPLFFPAPYVAPQSAQANCYGTPAFIQEISVDPGYTPVFSYNGTGGCGDAYLYDSCTGLLDPIAVLYPPASGPHAVVSYGTACYALSGSVADLRPYPVVPVAEIDPVLSCNDVVCTGADPNGSVIQYDDETTGLQVNVRFPHVEAGLARWGAAAQSSNDGIGPTPETTVPFVIRDSAQIPIATFQEAATIHVQTSHASLTKRLVLTRGVVSLTFPLRAGSTQATMPVQAGDQLSLDFMLMSKLLRNTAFGFVTYRKIVHLPRLYDTAVVPVASSTAIHALGFCGLTARSAYTFYGTLPLDTTTDFPNPDTLVTAQGSDTPELLLVRALAAGDVAEPTGFPWYAGQSFSGPITFRFYAARDPQGAHGEMDVWMDTDQPFPASFGSGQFKSLALHSGYYRRTTQVGDTSRNSLRAGPGGAPPNIFTASDGERISATASGTVAVNSKTFVQTGTDLGVSAAVLRLS